MGENRRIWRTFRKNRIAVIGLVLTLIIGLIAILAPVISPYSPVEQDVLNQYNPPGGEHFFGTDNYGRDILSRIIWASRISLIVGFFSVLFGMVVGSIGGVVAGYVGGWGEGIIMRAVDIGLSFPTLVLGLVIMAVLGSGLDKLVIAIGVAMAPWLSLLPGAAILITVLSFNMIGDGVRDITDPKLQS